MLSELLLLDSFDFSSFLLPLLGLKSFDALAVGCLDDLLCDTEVGGSATGAREGDVVVTVGGDEMEAGQNSC